MLLDAQDGEDIVTIPLTRIEERLSVAYVTAVAACGQASCSVTGTADDYGVDAQLRRVSRMSDGTYCATGVALDLQIKATTTAQVRGNVVAYDMKADAYNRMVQRDGALQQILVLLCLPPAASDWLSTDEQQLVMRRCCYWYYVEGPPTANSGTTRILIPRTQLFTPQMIDSLLQMTKDGRLVNANVQAAVTTRPSSST